MFQKERSISSLIDNEQLNSVYHVNWSTHVHYESWQYQSITPKCQLGMEYAWLFMSYIIVEYAW